MTNIENADWNVRAISANTVAWHPSVAVSAYTAFPATTTTIQNNANSTTGTDVTNRNRFGCLYNVPAIINYWHPGNPTAHTTPMPQERFVDNLSPEGWTIPSRAQFEMLHRYTFQITGTGAQASQALSFYHTNETGFSARGGRQRGGSGAFNPRTAYLTIDGYNHVPNAHATSFELWHQITVYRIADAAPPGTTFSASFVTNSSVASGDYIRILRVDLCADGHNFQFTSTTAPSCLAPGFDTYFCSNCEIVDRRNFVDALGHDWVPGPGGQLPTCTQEGYGAMECTRCGAASAGGVVPKLPHNFQFEERITATACGEESYDLFKCSNCPETEKRDIIVILCPPANKQLDPSTFVLTWDAVNNATGYEVVVNGGTAIPVATTSLDLSSIISTSFVSNITMRTMGNTGQGFITSDWSVALSHNLPEAEAGTFSISWDPDGLTNSGPNTWLRTSSSPTALMDRGIEGVPAIIRTPAAFVNVPTTPNVYGLTLGANANIRPTAAAAVAAGQFATITINNGLGSGVNLTFTDVKTTTWRSGAGANNLEVEYSVDGGTTFIRLTTWAHPAAATTQSTGAGSTARDLDLSDIPPVAPGNNLIIRLVPWGTAPETANNGVQIIATAQSAAVGETAFIITGTAVAIP
jgi:hypothetical protein